MGMVVYYSPKQGMETGQDVVKYHSVNLHSIDIPTIMRGETGIIRRDRLERDEHMKINAMQGTT
jgi:hypothetical protein